MFLSASTFVRELLLAAPLNSGAIAIRAILVDLPTWSLQAAVVGGLSTRKARSSIGGCSINRLRISSEGKTSAQADDAETVEAGLQ